MSYTMVTNLVCFSHCRSSDERIYSHSQMARSFDHNANPKYENATLSGAWRNNSNLSQEINQLDTSVMLGYGHASRASNSDRHTIVSNTRNIAALAARKRNKAQTNLTNIEKRDTVDPRPLYRPSNERNSERDAYLTPSRLDKHNRTFVPDHPYVSISKAPSEDSLSITTKHTVISEKSLPPLRRVGEANGDRSRNVRQWVPMDNNGKRKQKNKKDASYTHQVINNFS